MLFSLVTFYITELYPIQVMDASADRLSVFSPARVVCGALQRYGLNWHPALSPIKSALLLSLSG